MNETTSSACFHPSRRMNSRKGSITASASVRGPGRRNAGSFTAMVIAMPGSMNAAVIQ
jgi:hypothetical protein